MKRIRPNVLIERMLPLRGICAATVASSSVLPFPSSFQFSFVSIDDPTVPAAGDASIYNPSYDYLTLQLPK